MRRRSLCIASRCSNCASRNAARMSDGWKLSRRPPRCIYPLSRKKRLRWCLSRRIRLASKRGVVDQQCAAFTATEVLGLMKLNVARLRVPSLRQYRRNRPWALSSLIPRSAPRRVRIVGISSHAGIVHRHDGRVRPVISAGRARSSRLSVSRRISAKTMCAPMQREALMKRRR